MDKIINMNQQAKYGDPFYDLVGTEVTFRGEIISNSGQISHEKGSKSTIEYILYTPAHSYRPIPDIWIKNKLNIIKLEGVYGHWIPNAFVEFQNQKSLEN